MDRSEAELLKHVESSVALGDKNHLVPSGSCTAAVCYAAPLMKWKLTFI